LKKYYKLLKKIIMKSKVM